MSMALILLATLLVYFISAERTQGVNLALCADYGYNCTYLQAMRTKEIQDLRHS